MPTDFKNYNGSTLAEELMVTINDGLYDVRQWQLKFNVEYNCFENQLNIELIDLISVADQYYGHVAEVKFFSDKDLLTDEWGGIKLVKEEITSMNQIIVLTKTTLIKHTPLGEYI